LASGKNAKEESPCAKHILDGRMRKNYQRSSTTDKLDYLESAREYMRKFPELSARRLREFLAEQ
jgi:GTP1/Obg family GTP-binding protein